MNAPDTTLPEELLLLALDPRVGKPRCSTRFLQYGLSGAALAELEGRGRVAEERGRIVVTNPLATGDPVLDLALASLAQAVKGKGVRVQRWIRGTSRAVEEACLARLVERGAIRVESRRALGLFPYRRYLPAGADWSTPALGRLQGAAKVRFPDPRSRALAGLVSAVDLAPRLFPGMGDPRRLRADMRRLAREQWPALAVRRIVQSEKSADGAGG